MFMEAPREHVRYRSNAGGQWDTRWYADEPLRFTDSAGVTWTQTAVTTRRYGDFDAAVQELDRIERENAALERRYEQMGEEAQR